MTPQLQQAIKLLQLSNLELADLCRGASSSRTRCSSATSDRPSRAEAPAAEPAGRDQPPSRTQRAPGTTMRRQRGRGQARLSPAIPRPGATRATAAGGDDLPGLDQTLVAAETLRDHLAGAALGRDPRARRPRDRRHLIDLIDEAGYLAGDSRRRRRAARLRRSRASRRRCCGCSASIRPASSPATSPNAWRCSSRSATASIRRCRRCSRICRCSPARDVQQLMRLCGVDAEDLADDGRRRSRRSTPSPASSSMPRRAEPVMPDIFLRAAARRRLDRSSSTATRCRACSSTTATTPR